MALPAFMHIQGIRGLAAVKTREDAVAVLGVEHEIVVGAGGVTHGRYRILKDVDNATCPFLKALDSGKVFHTVTIRFWKLPRSGSEENHLTVVLNEAKVVGHRFKMHNTRDPALQGLPESEEVVFEYESISYSTSICRMDSSSNSQCTPNDVGDPLKATQFMASAEESLSDLVGGKAKQVGADLASALAAQGKEIGAAIAEGVRDGLKPADPEAGGA